MILAEKLSQKLNNLKSKNEINDYFIFFDEYRSLELTMKDKKLSSHDLPTNYTENSDGKYLIVWDDEYLSSGVVNTSSVNDFEEFISVAEKSKVRYDAPVFIPERGIYPMIITYSKPLADMIDIPEYLLKLTDLTEELDTMVASDKGTSIITVRDGIRYAYSSRFLDEYYTYTKFSLEKKFDDLFTWYIEGSDIFSIAKFQEVFSFFGDIYNGLKSSKAATLKKSETVDLILSPLVFRRLFTQQVLDNISGEHMIKNQSVFKPENFKDKLKCFNTFSLSYDPLLGHKLGTYRFTSYGLKPQRQYFIKFGKLDTPITNSINFSKVGQSAPSMEIGSFGNLKFEGIKKRTYNEIVKSMEPVVFGVNDSCLAPKNKTNTSVHFRHALKISKNKYQKLENLTFSVNLIDYIRKGDVELVEFPDGQLGCKINGLSQS